MRKLNEIKKEISAIRFALDFVINKLKLKFTVDEILNFDSITFNEIDYEKREYSILANENYFVESNGTFKRKSTRHNIFFCRLSKLAGMKENERDTLINDYLNIVRYHNFYKHVLNELKLIVDFGYPRISRIELLKVFDDNDSTIIKLNKEVNFIEYSELKEFYLNLMDEINEYKTQRSKFLEKKLSKNK